MMSAIYMDSSGSPAQAVSGVPVDSSERRERADMLLLMSLNPAKSSVMVENFYCSSESAMTY